MFLKDSIINSVTEALKIYSPSGSEETMLDYIKKVVADSVDEIYIDTVGNLVAHRKACKEGGRKILISAHADEIGFMIHYIDDNGFLYFKEIGGIDTNLLSGLRLDIITPNGIIKGIIVTVPIHLQDRQAKPKDLESSDLCIDIGARNKKEAMDKVSIGDCATFENSINNMGSIVYSKALDNKAGLVVLMGIVENFKSIESNNDIYFVASVQEELGARGAKVATFNINPDFGIAIDVTHATDYPSLSSAKFGDIRLGGGTVLAKGPNIDKNLGGMLESVAKNNNIEIQIEAISRSTGTDANPMQIECGGVKTALVSIPCRYMHTPNEAVDLQDIQSTINLLSNFLIYLNTDQHEKN